MIDMFIVCIGFVQLLSYLICWLGPRLELFELQ